MSTKKLQIVLHDSSLRGQARPVLCFWFQLSFSSVVILCNFPSLFDEQTTTSTLPKTSRDGFVVRSSDLTDEDIDELKQQGYTLSEQTDDGFSVFIELTQQGCTLLEQTEDGFYRRVPSVPEKESSASAGVVVEPEEDASSDEDAPVFKGQDDVYPCVWRSSTVGTPQSVAGQSQRTFLVPDSGDQEVAVQVVLEHALDRNYPERTGLCLRVKQVSFGVINSVNKKHHRGHFVHRLVVTASPTEKWNTKVDHVKIEPSEDSNIDTFSKQKTATVSIGANIDYKNPVQVGYSTARGTTTGSISAHGWTAKRDFKTQSVTWAWELRYWKDGQPFSSSKPGKFNLQSIPELPFANPGYVELNKFAAEAEWRVPNIELEAIEDIEWSINVVFYTFMIQEGSFLGFKNRLLGGYSFREIELPPLVSKITKKVNIVE